MPPQPLPTTFGFLAIILCSATLAACSGNSGGRDDAGEIIPAVEAVQARYGSLPLTDRLSGLVKAKNQVEISPEVSAIIVQVHVSDGDTVSKGQPLVRLRDNEFRERLRQAKAAYDIAVAQAKQTEAERDRLRNELNRAQSMSEKDLSSPAEFELVQSRAIAADANHELANARVEQAHATMDESDDALSRTTIRAPVQGTVGNRNAEVGMLVTPSTRMFTIGQLDTVRVEVILTDRMLGYIEAGQHTEIITHNSPTGALAATVSRISPFLHPVTHTTDAEIDLANAEGRLRSGMFVPVDIYYGESEQATLIPLSALYENPETGRTGVYVCRDTLTWEPASETDQLASHSLTDPVNFIFVPVEILARGRMNAGVEGVNPGEWIVTIGQDLLQSDTAMARVRPVHWTWVEKLQNAQREDLLEEVLVRRDRAQTDSLTQDPQSTPE